MYMHASRDCAANREARSSCALFRGEISGLVHLGYNCTSCVNCDSSLKESTCSCSLLRQHGLTLNDADMPFMSDKHTKAGIPRLHIKFWERTLKQ